MKAFISVDLEGLPFVVTLGHLNLKGSLFKEAREIATKLTLAVTDELHKNGYDKIIIADSHGPAINLLVEDLPECIELVRGTPRPISMVAGVEGCDVGIDPAGRHQIGRLVAVVEADIRNKIAPLHQIGAARHVQEHRAGLLPPGVVGVEVFAGVVNVTGQPRIRRIMGKSMKSQAI